MQTFTFEGVPGIVALETLRFEEVRDGRSRLRAQALVDSFEAATRCCAAVWRLTLDEGYAKLERMLIDGAV